MVDKIKVAVLGATGMVGQRFVQLLSNHPWFEINYLAASSKHYGKKYCDIVNWYVSPELPPTVADIPMGDVLKHEEIPPETEIVFSALPSDIASRIEPELAKRGFTVVSNASAFRMEPDIPLINPEVNYEHIKLLDKQRARRGWKGSLLKDPNCTTAILTLSLAPIHRAFGIEKVIVTSMQSISGAGLTGVPAYVITDNIVPFIEKEEYKVAEETKKILGTITGNQDIIKPEFMISAITTRVPVLDSHLISVHVKLKTNVPVDEVIQAWQDFRSLPQELRLPTAPERPIIVSKRKDRPQPRLDRYAGKGMSVVVGRVAKVSDKENWFKYVVLGHNTIRGAAGNAVLIAELLQKLKYSLEL